MKTYWVIYNNEPMEVNIVGKYITKNEWYTSKFKYVYQVALAGHEGADEQDVTREDIYLTREAAELAISAKENLEKIRKAEIIIREYKEAVQVIEKAKKEGLQDINVAMELDDILKNKK